MKKFTLLLFFLSINIYATDIICNDFIIPPQECFINPQEKGIDQNDLEKIKKEIALFSPYEIAKLGFYSVKIGQVKILVKIDATYTKNDQYSIAVSKNTIEIKAKNAASLMYAKQTLHQLIDAAQATQNDLPKTTINDWANFEKRGYMLDISRDKVPTMESMYLLINQLSEWRINELQLYTEHTFAYKNHKVVWEDSSPFTAEEIRELDKYCKERYIDLVPNQNSFGHLENWLKHDEYLDLCECETDCKTIWGNRKRTSLDPTNPKSLELIKELYSELLPNFTSKYLNIGCDETVELCLGKSKPVCDSIGKGRVYLNFLKQLNNEANKRGRLAQFWGDIILNHPELIDEIPKNMTPLVWGYSATYPFNKNLPAFKKAGLDFYVCPGTSTWRSEIGRNQNAFDNLKNAAIEGVVNNAKGYLITDWGDYGHFQPRAVSYATILLGASYAWNYQENSLSKLESNLNKNVFKDRSKNTAKALLILGDAYLKTNIPAGNANAFHLMIRRFEWKMKEHYQTKKLHKEGLIAAEKEIKRGLQILAKATPKSKDAKIVLKETQQAANLAMFGIHLGLARLNAKDYATENIPTAEKKELYNELKLLVENHKKLWLVRNRKGGLQKSVSKLESLLSYLQK